MTVMRFAAYVLVAGLAAAGLGFAAYSLLYGDLDREQGGIASKAKESVLAQPLHRHASTDQLPQHLRAAARHLRFDQWPVTDGNIIPGFIAPADGALIASSASLQGRWSNVGTRLEVVLWPIGEFVHDPGDARGLNNLISDSHLEGLPFVGTDYVAATRQDMQLAEQGGNRRIDVNIQVYPAEVNAYAALVGRCNLRGSADLPTGLGPEPFEKFESRTSGAAGAVAIVNSGQAGAFDGGPGKVTFVSFARKNVTVTIDSHSGNPSHADWDPVCILSLARWLDSRVAAVPAVSPAERESMRPAFSLAVDRQIIKALDAPGELANPLDESGFSCTAPSNAGLGSGPWAWEGCFGFHLKQLLMSGDPPQGTFCSLAWSGEKQLAVSCLDLATGVPGIATASVLVEDR